MDETAYTMVKIKRRLNFFGFSSHITPTISQRKVEVHYLMI